MLHPSGLLNSLSVALLLYQANALPAPQDKAAGNEGIIDGPPGASGELRGPESLLGYNPSNPFSQETTVIPSSDFELAPVQSAEEDTGFYLPPLVWGRHNLSLSH